MIKTASLLALWALLCGLAGSWLGATAGWLFFSGGLCVMLLLNGLQLSRVSAWVHRDINSPPPASVGPWDEVLAPIYRTLRRNRQDIDQLNRHVDRIMLAAEALPDGAITLDEQMQLNWCNGTAREHLGLDLLTLSALESSPKAESEPVDVGAIIHTALQQGRALSGGQHVFVENIATDLNIQGKDTELASAVSNLLTNAIRYTPKDGIITVSWYETEDGHACYSVQDTGIGIAAQDIPRLTERFYRVDRGRSRATGGTGLGLAITKHLAMRHQAELQIQSRYGAGSLFSLVFPPSRVVKGGS